MMQPHVRFRSTAFNASEPREYFINECCFGDDLCSWLIGQLRERGIETDEKPGQEDFGWYFNFAINGNKSCFIAGFEPSDPAVGGQWHGWIERDCGFLTSLFGGRKRRIDQGAVETIDQILRGTPLISHVTWEDE